MEYTYVLETISNKHITSEKTRFKTDMGVCYILCYYIDSQGKYPFLQFMMEKLPFCNNIIKEEFILPYLITRSQTDDIKMMAFEKVREGLHNIGCANCILHDNMFKGLLYSSENKTPYILINITGVNNIGGSKLFRNSPTWFILPSEIINTKRVCNIPINNETIELFTNNPQIALLTDSKTNTNYILPDAVYTGGNIKAVEFNSVFGNGKTKIYNSCDEYYYFYRCFGNAVVDGHKADVKGGINRYALFLEGKIYMETEKEFSLSDDIIEKMYPETCIIICYSNLHEIKPDILVKEYESFISLSYHVLDDTLLDACYVNNKSNDYMIV